VNADRSKARYAFVDALRGVAAVAVVLFHIYSKNLRPMTGYEFPEPLHSIFEHGNLGVMVFFVISGFVIAQSIRGAFVTPRYVGWFALRRSLRLDPPYWATIAAMIALTYISNHAQHDRSLPMPSLAGVIAHLFYAQGFLGYPQIVGVFWTLCYEIQFYLSLVILIGVWQRTRDFVSSRWVLFGPLWVVSLFCIAGKLAPTPALFVYGWPFFFLGVVVNWVHNGEEHPFTLAITIAGSLAVVTFAPLQISIAIVTALAIHTVSRLGWLQSLTLGPVLQYLGRISYSLYLVHMLVGTPLVRFFLRLLGKRPDFVHASALVVLATVVSIIAAHVMYVVIERPAIRWSHKLRRFDRAEPQAS
jgi:peptidoglycan/LPS O-acetylase OafA/YrhL